MRAVIAVTSIVFVLGCGYKLAGFREGEPQRIAVVTLRNDSVEPAVEFLVSEALREEGKRRGGFRLVENPANADLVIGGRVMPIQTTVETISSVVLAIEYTIWLSLTVDVRTNAGARTRIPKSATRDAESYLASADFEVEKKNRQEALRRLSQVLAGRVYDALPGKAGL